MAINIVEFTEQYEVEVDSFNDRLSSNNIPFSFPSKAKKYESDDLGENRYPTEYYYLAVDEAGKVHGGYIYQEHQFVLKGATYIFGCMKLPLSEGIIDKAYNMVGIMLVRHALTINPFVYALGMGGEEGPFAKLLRAMGWQITLIPFYFSILNSTNFLRNINVLRTNHFRSRMLDFTASCGLGWLVHALFESIISIKNIRTRKASSVLINRFAEWTDEIWNSVSTEYPFVSVRDAATLNRIYRIDSTRFKHMKIIQSDKVIGWSTLLDITKTDSPYFGNMRVMCIINSHCVAGKEAALVNALKIYSRSSGYDLLVGNFSYHNYLEALQACGFMLGPSNLALALSPNLSKLREQNHIESNMMHITRGDGDGE